MPTLIEIGLTVTQNLGKARALEALVAVAPLYYILCLVLCVYYELGLFISEWNALIGQRNKIRGIYQRSKIFDELSCTEAWKTKGNIQLVGCLLFKFAINQKLKISNFVSPVWKLHNLYCHIITYIQSNCVKNGYYFP